mgnify:FL=1
MSLVPPRAARAPPMGWRRLGARAGALYGALCELKVWGAQQGRKSACDERVLLR